jgi:Ribbon-helix-helix protein, copG family
VITHLPPGLHDALKKRAKEEERSQAQIVRRALHQYLGTDGDEAVS